MTQDDPKVTPEPKRLLRIAEIKAMTGLSKSTIYRMQKTSDFPKVVRLSARTSAWPAAAVHEWIAKRLSGGASS